MENLYWYGLMLLIFGILYIASSTLGFKCSKAKMLSKGIKGLMISGLVIGSICALCGIGFLLVALKKQPTTI
jgi:hypothetical protein